MRNSKIIVIGLIVAVLSGIVISGFFIFADENAKVIIDSLLPGKTIINSNLPGKTMIESSLLDVGVPVKSGLVLHLDADAITGLSDNDAVATWSDLSGEGNDATQATSENRPLYKTNILNGKPVLRFDATKALIVADADSLDITPRITIFAVAAPRITDTGHRRIVIKGISSWAEPYYMYGLWNNVATIGFGVSTSGARRWTTFDGGIQAGVAYIWGGVYDQTSLHYYVDGDSKGTLNETRAMDINDEPLRIGSTQTTAGDTWWDGDIAEILIYNRALSTAEREQVEQYLGKKWLGW